MVARWIGVSLAAFAFLGGAITLIGWLSGRPDLTDWDGDGISMFANTAFAMMLSGLATMLLQFGGRPWIAGVVATLGAVVGVLGAAILSQHLFSTDLGIDRLLVEPAWGQKAAMSPGRMGPPASSSFTLLGAALVLSCWSGWPRRAAALLGVAATLAPVISWTAYLYEAEMLYSIPKYTGIARQSAALMICAATALVVGIHEHGLGRLLRRDDAGGTLTRRLLPIGIVLLLATGWLESVGSNAKLYDPAFGKAMLTVVRIFMFGLLIWWTANALVAQGERRRAAERKLLASEERLRQLVDVIPQLAWTADSAGRGLWYNKPWYEYTGESHSERAAGWIDLAHPNHREEVRRTWERAVREGTPWEHTFLLRAQGGGYRWFLTRGRPLRNAESAGETGPDQWFVTATDISDQRAAEDALRHANQIKDEFLATLSHELRTPMSAILGWCKILERAAAKTASPDPRLAQSVEVIGRNAKLQAQIIDDLLDVSRILSGKVTISVESIELSEVAKAAVEAVRPAAEVKGIAVEVECEPDFPTIRGDSARLQQVIYNLLTNAIKFSQRGGRVDVFCRRVGSHVEVAVRDQGKGIAPEFLPFVFDRFRQEDASTTRSFGGLGIGLSICKQIAELHGGSMGVESEGKGRGAAFTLRLPIAAAVLGPAPSAADGRADAAGRSLNAAGGGPEERLDGVSVLVVDDEPDARAMLVSLFEDAGARVRAVGTGGEAIAAVSAERPDVLLCDIGMPGMDGIEVIRTVRAMSAEEGGSTPAVALTAFARAEERKRSLDAGFQVHLSKPVDFRELVACVRTLTPVRR